jgi:hypothetical protein
MTALKFPKASSARIAELAEILAAGLMRALARKSNQISPSSGESSLHFSPGKSGHQAPTEEK